MSLVSLVANQRGYSTHLSSNRRTSHEAKHAAFEVKSPESDRRFTQKLWKSLWKRSSFTPMLPANVNVLAVCTKAGRPTTARFVAAKTCALYCSQEESIEGVPNPFDVCRRDGHHRRNAMKAFNQTMKTRFRDVTNDAGSIGPETAQSH